MPGEVVFRVPSLGDPRSRAGARAASELLRYEAVRLFVERAAAAAPGFALDDENAADVARICFRLDGLPLALELAAGRLGALGPATIAERLDDRFRLLRSGSHAAPTRQQTLAATLQWSHDLLEPDERDAVPRGWRYSPAASTSRRSRRVCAGGDLDAAGDRRRARAARREVARQRRASASRERRYRLLETVRLYARERLDEAGETAALAERARALGARARRGASAARPRLDRDAANLRAALDTLLDARPAATPCGSASR